MDFFSEDGGARGGIAAGTPKGAGPGAWQKEYPRSRTGTCLPLRVDVPSSAASAGVPVPPLQLVWKGEEALDKLHLAFRVSIPPGSFDSAGSSSAKGDKDKAAAAREELVEGHCATGLEKLCKLALCTADHGTGAKNVHVKTSIAQLLLKDGVPMYNIDSNTLQVPYC